VLDGGAHVGKTTIDTLLEIREPWHMVGAIALGCPLETAAEAKPRKTQKRIVMWFDDES
jgi:hypothetical protein